MSEERLIVIEKQISDIASKVDEVYYALTGNKIDGGRGLVWRLNEAEKKNAEYQKKIAELEKSIDKAKWITIGLAIGLGAAGGSAASFLLKILG